MKVSRENGENQQVVLTIEAAAEDWDKAIAQAAKTIAKEVNIPGFRRGKAPRHIIEQRIGKKALGFGADPKGKKQQNVGETLRELRPEDLLKFGLIPEFIGRLPVNVTLDALDEEALVRILKEPRNALVKQYQKLVELDGAELVFEDDALQEIAHLAIERKSGARGLRSIIENAMLDTLFELPGRKDVRRCVITKEVITDGQKPTLELGEAPARLTHRAKRPRVIPEEPSAS